MEAILLWLVAVAIVAAGLVGLLFPAIPGAPLLFLGLVAAAWADDFAYVGTTTLVLLAVMAALTYLVDIAAGVFGAQRFGASSQAMLGAGIGALVGIFFGLAGIVLGPFIGAGLGELSRQRSLRAAGRAGIGATLGLVLGVAVKIALAFAMLGVFVIARWL